MLKKTFLFSLFLSLSSLSFASNTSVTIVPDQPSKWGYLGAIVLVNQQSSKISQGTTFPVSVHDIVTITRVVAMNAEPIIDESCQNIEIRDEGPHQLLFQLKKDWKIHCKQDWK